MGDFAAHGSVALDAKDNVLVIEASGPWNKEMMKQYFLQGDPLKRAFSSDGWGVLLIARGEPFIIDDAVPSSIDNIIKDKSLGRRATAIIIDVDEGYELSKSLFTRIYEQANEKLAFFEDKASALSWLKETLMTELVE